jgi:ATP-dependent RNA helicase DeaD
LNNFEKLGLSSSIIEVLDQMGFTDPTPIQKKAIPQLLQNDPTDFIGLAHTGTGKTAAFGLPLIDMVDAENRSIQALIMAPTRELGQQIAQQLNFFSEKHKKLTVEVVYGGADISRQIKALKNPVQILVATPGRLLDLIRRKALKLEEVSYVVLDEADEMLNMGFKEDIDQILSFTGDDRSIWLFSATMPPDIRKLVKKYMAGPIEVSIDTQEKINRDISHKYVTTKTANKLPALRRFLDIQPDMRGILFCRTKRETQQIADELSSLGYGVEALHGDLTQAQRDAVMKRFRARSMQLLIATDVAARGIDVNDLTHVLHHTLPDQLEGYTHRSGRTGRAGKKGVSLAFINPREGKRITELEKKNNVTFERITVPGVDELKSSRINHWANLIVNTKVDERSGEIIKELHGKFAHLSKEDLLKRLITTQLDHLFLAGEYRDDDLNEIHDVQHAGKNKNGYHRYFVNIGVIDGMTEMDLVHFLSDVSGIDRKHFADLMMQKNFAYFNVNADQDKGLDERFEGIEIEGRSIRVNRDDQHKGPEKFKKRNRGKGKPARRKFVRSGKIKR